MIPNCQHGRPLHECRTSGVGCPTQNDCCRGIDRPTGRRCRRCHARVASTYCMPPARTEPDTVPALGLTLILDCFSLSAAQHTLCTISCATSSSSRGCDCASRSCHPCICRHDCNKYSLGSRPGRPCRGATQIATGFRAGQQ